MIQHDYFRWGSLEIRKHRQPSHCQGAWVWLLLTGALLLPIIVVLYLLRLRRS